MLTTDLFRYTFQNAPFRSQIFKIFFARGSKGALTPFNQNPPDAAGRSHLPPREFVVYLPRLPRTSIIPPPEVEGVAKVIRRKAVSLIRAAVPVYILIWNNKWRK